MAQGPRNLTGLHEHLERAADILAKELNADDFQHLYNVLLNLASQFSFGERPVLLPKKLHDCLEAHRKKIDPKVNKIDFIKSFGFNNIFEYGITTTAHFNWKRSS